MVGSLAAGFEPLRRYADFSGRARRSDLALFWLVTMMAALLVEWSEAAVYISGAPINPEGWSTLLGAMLLCPWAALAVRRLHDSGRSGWWLLLALPALLIKLRDWLAEMNDPIAVPLEAGLPLLVVLPVGLALLALVVLLLWEDEDGSNRYGPNPRYGAVKT